MPQTHIPHESTLNKFEVLHLEHLLVGMVGHISMDGGVLFPLLHLPLLHFKFINHLTAITAI